MQGRIEQEERPRRRSESGGMGFRGGQDGVLQQKYLDCK